jgi:hypothetical protein
MAVTVPTDTTPQARPTAARPDRSRQRLGPESAARPVAHQADGRPSGGSTALTRPRPQTRPMTRQGSGGTDSEDSPARQGPGPPTGAGAYIRRGLYPPGPISARGGGALRRLPPSRPGRRRRTGAVAQIGSPARARCRYLQAGPQRPAAERPTAIGPGRRRRAGAGAQIGSPARWSALPNGSPARSADELAAKVLRSERSCGSGRSTPSNNGQTAVKKIVNSGQAAERSCGATRRRRLGTQHSLKSADSGARAAGPGLRRPPPPLESAAA